MNADRARPSPLLVLLFFVLVPGVPLVADAVGTRTFRATSFREFDEGDATGVTITAAGEVAPGWSSEKTEIAEPSVFCSAVGADGTVYFGTGDQGGIYAWSRGKARLVTRLDTVLVTALAVGEGSTLYAGVAGSGTIYAVDVKASRASSVATVEAEHVWALEYERSRRVLWAATGSPGRLFAIELDAKPARARQAWDSGQKHLMTMLRMEDGAFALGSADQGILFRVTPSIGSSPEARVLHDFEGEEIRALARRGGSLYISVAEIQRTGAPAPVSVPAPSKGTKITAPATPPPPAPAQVSRDRKSKGAVFRLDSDGRLEQLHAVADGYFAALGVDDAGNVLAAAAAAGKIYQLRPDRSVVTLLDFPERQVLTLAWDGSHWLAGTADAGAVYRLDPSPARAPVYTTKAFDATLPARWGTLRWLGRGDLKVETRSGNTATPDKFWSDWKGLDQRESFASGGTGRIGSAPARYLQTRVHLGSKALLRELTMFYAPQNQRPRLSEVTFSDDAAPRLIAALAAPKPRSTVLKIRWKADAVDGDELVYRLAFRQEGETRWRTLGGPDPLTRTEYEWNTESVPDGEYVVRVTCTDERSNPRTDALEHELVSLPVTVDNRKPDIAQLKVSPPNVTARISDTQSPISEAAYSVDGGDWMLVGARDGLFDELTEEISFSLGARLEPGTHVLSLRASDTSGNIGAAQTTVTVK